MLLWPSCEASKTIFTKHTPTNTECLACSFRVHREKSTPPPPPPQPLRYISKLLCIDDILLSSTERTERREKTSARTIHTHIRISNRTTAIDVMQRHHNSGRHSESPVSRLHSMPPIKRPIDDTFPRSFLARLQLERLDGRTDGLLAPTLVFLSGYFFFLFFFSISVDSPFYISQNHLPRAVTPTSDGCGRQPKSYKARRDSGSFSFVLMPTWLAFFLLPQPMKA